MKQKVLIAVFMSALLGLAMTLTASFIHSSWGIDTVWSLLISFGAGFVISFLIPLDSISNWFCSLFHLGREKPVLHALAGSAITDVIVTTLMALIMTLFAMRNQLSFYWQAFIADYGVMLLVGFVFAFLGTILIGLFMESRMEKQTRKDRVNNG
jgi:uncharacterized integral membrane protein